MSMLLGNKKTQGDEQNWCIVLNPLRNELDKRRVARKITEIFSLSAEEASDLVVNTPIILLDNLSRSIAAKVKEHFHSTGAELILTNDVLLKRKCYRTVWPEPPNLSFLREWDRSKESAENHEVLAVDQALHAIRSMTPREEQDAHEPVSDTVPIPGLSSVERSQLLEEVDRWMKECVTAREESAKLSRELDRLKKELAAARQVPAANPLIGEREKDVQELRSLLTSTEEKYEGLLAEYREARKLFEDKVTLSAQETEKGKTRIEELTAQIQALQKEKLGLHQTLQTLHQTLNETTEHYRQAKEESRQNRIPFEEKLASYAKEAEQEKARAVEATEKIKTLQRASETLERLVNERSEQLALWNERYEALSRKLGVTEEALAQERALRRKGEERQKDVEASQLRLIQELETKSQESRELEIRMRQLEKSFQELREGYANQEKLFEVNRRHLEVRERELESARRQLREVNVQAEQREVLQKRSQLANQLAEQEARLKILVKDQEKMEAEIREREEIMKKILSEQEIVEKEIMENKQTQRHLSEQAKLELAKKDRSSRVKSNRPEGEAPLQGQPLEDS